MQPDRGPALTDDQLVHILQRYLSILQRHRTAEEMMSAILTSASRIACAAVRS